MLEDMSHIYITNVNDAGFIPNVSFFLSSPKLMTYAVIFYFENACSEQETTGGSWSVKYEVQFVHLTCALCLGA